MKLVAIFSRVPFPLDKGDKLRAYHQLKQLNKQFDLKVICLSDTKIDQSSIDHLESEFNIEIIYLKKWLVYWNMVKAIFGSKPFQVHYFYQYGAQRKVNRILESFKPDHIYAQLIRTAEYVKHQHHIPKTLDYMDTFSKGMERRIEKATFPSKSLFKAESSRLVKYEHLIFEYFEHKTIISEQDRDLIYHEERNQIEIVRNGVDFEFFAPAPSNKPTKNIVFTGNMNYPPNIDGAQFLIQEIAPLVLKEIPEAKFIIAGATPAKEVKELQNSWTTVTGWIDDIRDAYNEADVFIAPMRIGTGLQNKLLEAMAMQTPSITTQLANNALKAKPNEEILIGDAKEELSAHIVSLLKDPEFSEHIAKKGREYVQQNFSWETATNKLSNIIRTSEL